MRYLLDTNIFLEVLLNQDSAEACKDFINKNQSTSVISDFTLHSIGVILFRFKKHEIFNLFITEITSSISIYTLPFDNYKMLSEHNSELNLDFDDSYQYSMAKHYNLEIVTKDKDFKVVKDIPVTFI